MRRTWALIGIALAATVLVAWAADQARVVEREARIRADKRKFGKTLAVVREGETIDIVNADPPWVRVRKGGVEGWLHEAAVTRDKDYRFSAASLAGTEVEASERTAGQKGFGSETERAYRASKPALAAGYAQVDSIDAAAPADTQVSSFMRQGKLAGGGR